MTLLNVTARRPPAVERAPEDAIPIAQAWALVAMADRINDGKYVKFVEYAIGENGVPTDVIAYRPNRELIADSIANGSPAVSDEDRERGAKMAEHFKGLMFDALTGEQHEFDQKILNLMQKEVVGARSGMAFLACMGSRYRKETTRERVQASIGAIGTTSAYQGQPGEKIQRSVKILSKFAGKTFLGSVVRATDGTNLYFWTSSQTVDYWTDDVEFKIQAHVKAHSKDQHGHQETRLTRVKIAT